MRDLLVSIIIPCHNSTVYLEETITSCLNQSYNNFEILLIENGSIDNTWVMCEKLVSKHLQIRAFQSDPNKKVGGARNIGIKEAKGYYILFVDDDDVLTNNALKDLLDHSLNGTADIVVGKRKHVLLNNKTYYTHYKPTGVIENILFTDQPSVFFGTPAKLHKTKFLIENNILFPETLVASEDFYFTMLTMIFAKTTVVLPSFCHEVYIYYVREDSSVNSWGNNFEFFINNLIISTTLTLDIWNKVSNDNDCLTNLLGSKFINYKEKYLALASKNIQSKFIHNLNFIFNNYVSDRDKILYYQKLKEAGIINKVKAIYHKKENFPKEKILPILHKKHFIYLMKTIISSFTPTSISKKLKRKTDLFI